MRMSPIIFRRLTSFPSKAEKSIRFGFAKKTRKRLRVLIDIDVEDVVGSFRNVFAWIEVVLIMSSILDSGTYFSGLRCLFHLWKNAQS